MGKLSKKTKKMLSLFLAILLVITGTSIVSVFAGEADKSDFEALGSSSLELGKSGSRLSLEVKASNDKNINYVLSKFGLKVTSPNGVVSLELPKEIDYLKENNTEAETAGLVSFNDKTRILTINFSEDESVTDLGSSNIEIIEEKTTEVEDSQVSAEEAEKTETLDSEVEASILEAQPEAESTNKEYKSITVNLIPTQIKDYTLKAEHNEGDKAEVVVSVKGLFAPMSAGRSGFALFDGKDLKDGDFTGYSHSNLIKIPRDLVVNADFGNNPASYKDRKVTINVNRGFRLYSAPGLIASGDNNLWKFDKKTLGDLEYDVTNVTFTRNPVLEFGKYQGNGGTITYEFGPGVQTAKIALKLIGDQPYLYAGFASPNWGTIDIPKIIEVKSERTAVDGSGTVLSESATLDKFTTTGQSIRTIGNRQDTLLIEPGKTATMQIFTYPGEGFVKSGSFAYNLPAGLSVTDVKSVYQSSLKDSDISFTTENVGGIRSILINFKDAMVPADFYITFKADPAEVIGTTYTLSLTKKEASFIFSKDGEKSYMDGGENLNIKIVGEATENLTLYNSNINVEVPDGVQVPLGGFRVKNEQPKALENQRIKMVFDDTKIKVNTVQISSSMYSPVKDIKIITHEGKEATIATRNTNINGLLIINLNQVFPGIGTSDSIKEISYQIPNIGKNTNWGNDGLDDAVFRHLVYFGTSSAPLNAGDSYSAKIYSTTGDNPDFDGTATVQSATTTSTINNTQKRIEIRGSVMSATQYAPGQKATITSTFSMDPSKNSSTSRYIKGFTFLFRDMPDTKIVDGSIKLSDNVNGVYTSGMIKTSYKTDNTGTNILQLDVDEAVLSSFNGTSASSLTVSYQLEVSKTARSASYKLNDYMLILPYDNVPNFGNQYGSDTINANRFDMDQSGNTTKKGISFNSTGVLTFTSKVDFNLSTAANLDDGPWITYDGTENGVIILNPLGNAKYRLLMDNNSGQSVAKFVAFIPVPKYGEWASTDPSIIPASPGDYNPGVHVQKDKFGWSTYITSEPNFSGSFGKDNFVVEYSTGFDLTDRSAGGQWKPWSAFSVADRKNIRTVRITSVNAIPDGANSEISFSMDLDDQADARAGNRNIYSAYVYRELPSSTASVPSQPVAIVLKTGVVSGLVFSDVNANGLKDISETGIYNVEVKAYKTGDISDTGLIETTHSDADGKYRFAGLDKTQDVDIVFVNPADISSLKFSVPSSTDNHVTAVFKQLTPSGGSYQGVNAGLIPAKVLNFNLNGADGTAPASIAKFPGELVPSIADVAWANYTFNGWFTKATGGTKITPTATTTIDDILNKITSDGGTNTLYAQWTRKTATITVQHYTYKDNISGAVQNGADVVSAGVNHGTTFTAVKKTIAGHTYKSADPSESVVVSGDVTIKLYYQADTKKITVNHYTYTNALTDKVLVGSSTTVNKYYGESYTEAEKTITGYTYDATNSVKTVTGITADTTLNLYYQANPAVITVEHYTYTATTSDAVLSGAKETINKRYGESYTATPRTIAGHAYNSSLSTFEITSITGPATLKLYYQAGAHTVTVNHYTYTNNVSDKVLNGAPDSASKFFGQSYTATQRTIPGYTYASANPSLTVTVTGNTTIDLFYQADQKVITVEHYTYTDNIGAAVLNGTADTVNKRYGESFTATKRVIPGHTYDSVGSVDTIASITENATLKLYYKAGSHTVTVKHYTYINTTADAVINGTDDTESKFYGESFAATHRTITGYTYDTANPSDTIAAVTAPATLNLYYKANLYDVTFNSDNGVADVVQQFPYQSKIIKPAIDPVKTGYTFDKWVKESDGTEWNFTTDTMPLNGIALKATYTVNSYKVTFDSNLGSAVVPAQVNYDFGTKLTQPVSTRPGYTLEGWYTLKPDGITLDTKWDFASDAMPAVNFTLKANWTVDTSKTVTVTFSPEGGTYTGPAADLLQVKNAGSVLVEPNVANLKKPGYKLDGWYTSKLGVGTKWIFTTTLEDARFIDTTLYANWVDDNAQSITVKYNLNGGKHSGITTIPDQQVFVKGYVTEPTGAMTKEGHTFGSWNIEGSDGKPTSNKWNFSTQITHENFNDVKLIAVWDVVKYNVTFDSDNGSTSKVVAFDFGTKLTAPTVPTKEGHTFDAWYNVDNTGNLTTKWNFATDTMPANGITLKAKWNVNSYKVSIDSDNGSAVVTQNVLFNQKAVKPILNPVKTGYTFEDWYLADSTGNLVSVWNFATNLVPSRDITIKAKWNLNSYQIEVEHYTYDTDINTPTLEKTVTATVNHFESYTAKPIEIPYHTFQKDKSNPANPTISVTGPAKFKLYYNADHYTMTLTNQLDLDVNDKYPAKDNKPSWDQIVQLLNAKTVNSNDKTKLFATKAAPVSFTSLTSSDYANVDFSATTSGYTQTFNVKAVWGNGDTQTLPVTVKISDKVAPIITNLTDSRKFELQAGKTAIYSEKDFIEMLKADNIASTDNYDGDLEFKIEYLDSKGFDSIKWNEVGEYAFYLTATDSSGNTIRKAAAISIYSVTEGDSSGGNNGGNGSGNGNKPDTSTPINPGNNGSGNIGTDNNGSGNTGSGNSNDKIPQTGGGGGDINSPGGNSFDKDGNLIDANGNILVNKNDLPKGSEVNSAGQLIDSKGNLINLNGLAGGQLPSTGIVAGGASIGLVALASGLLLAKKIKKKQGENQL